MNTFSRNAPLVVIPSGALSCTATLPEYPDYIFYSDGRILNKRRGKFLKENGSVSKGYRTVSLKAVGAKRKTVRVHKLIASAFHGAPEPGKHADHISRNKLDNSAANLRYVTRTENAQNRSPNKTGGSSDYQGVSLNRATGKYRANIMAEGKAIYLGQFVNEIDAANAYQMSKERYHKPPKPTQLVIDDHELNAAFKAFREGRCFNIST